MPKQLPLVAVDPTLLHAALRGELNETQAHQLAHADPAALVLILLAPA